MEGKTNAVVIGHVGASNGADMDFRDGKRAVFWNGNLILNTTKAGNIPQKVIDKAIEDYKSNKTVTEYK